MTYSQSLMDKYRCVNVDHGWYEGVVDYWKKTLLPEFERECPEFVRKIARRIYRELEAEYEYLTSDEMVRDFIAENVPAEDIEEVDLIR